MAAHEVALKVSNEIAVGTGDIEIPVKRNGRRFAVLTVSRDGLSWRPSTAKAPSTLSWDELQEALKSSAPAPSGRGGRKSAASSGGTGSRGASRKSTGNGRRRGAGSRAAEQAAESGSSGGETAPAKASASTSAAKKSTSGAGPDASVVRAWARENDVPVSARGKVSSTVIDQYLAAQQ